MHFRNFKINDNSVSMERLNGEVVIISFLTGQFYSSTGSGADILSLIKEGLPSEGIIQVITTYYSNFNYEHSGLDVFVSNLLTAGIIEETTQTTENQSVQLPKDLVRTIWNKPELLIHDEIHGLLLVDPIHDTDTEGWPKLKNDRK